MFKAVTDFLRWWLLGEIVRCPVCHGPLEAGESTAWSRHFDSWLHVDCIPAIVANLGPKQTRVWLRHGSGALFPSMYQPEPVERAEPSRWPL